MISQLTKHENSWAVVIDQPMIDLLKIEPETLLEVTTDGQVLTIKPMNDVNRRKRFEEALEEANREFGAVLQKLAE